MQDGTPRGNAARGVWRRARAEGATAPPASGYLAGPFPDALFRLPGCPLRVIEGVVAGHDLIVNGAQLLQDGDDFFLLRVGEPLEAANVANLRDDGAIEGYRRACD